MITNMSLNYANDARMAVIDFEKASKSCEACGSILGVRRREADSISFIDALGNDWEC